MLLAIINRSTLVSNDQLTTIAAAIQIQLDLHFLPAWNLKSGTVRFYADETKVPGYAWRLYVIDDDSQVQGALGYHQEENNGVIDGYVMCKPILDNGGTVMTFDPSNPTQYSVSATISHEALETFGDTYTNKFAVGTQVAQGNLYCVEMSDPCEALSYGINVNGTEVAVSNFIFPSWINPSATVQLNMPFDYLKQLSAPFTMTTGGYMIVATFSNEGQITASHLFGEDMPEWRKEMKRKKFARSQKRFAK